ncbi:MAG: hypothetical protein ACT4QF_05730 [Sporichthyaceae bacterium]
MTTESTDGRSRLQATFVGVVGLQLSWPEQQPVSLDVVEIGDVSAHGLEDISFRVAEGAGFFAFSCREFFAVAIRET